MVPTLGVGESLRDRFRLPVPQSWRVWGVPCHARLPCVPSRWICRRSSRKTLRARNRRCSRGASSSSSSSSSVGEEGTDTDPGPAPGPCDDRRSMTDDQRPTNERPNTTRQEGLKVDVEALKERVEEVSGRAREAQRAADENAEKARR